MSNALAIAGVTAVLRDLLDSGMIDHQVTDAVGQGVSVTAAAPDTVPLEGSSAKPQINLFLHQVSHNAAMRNLDLPARNRDGSRASNAPLALDLHYLVTAYGTGDLQAEVLLGYAMQLLHENPIPSRDAIRMALRQPDAPVDGALLPSAYQALRASDLAEQVEQIKISPVPMSTEEMSKLWSALQAHYRPTAAYQVTVVLVQANRSARAALPVLTRGRREPSAVDPGELRETGIVARASLSPSTPAIDSIRLPARREAAHLGDAVELVGTGLGGIDHALLLSLPRLGIDRIVPLATSAGDQFVSFDLPGAVDSLPAGSYLASLQLRRPGEPFLRTTGQLSLRVAPEFTSAASPLASATIDADGNAEITLGCRPDVLPEQRVSLLLGDREVFAEPRAASTGTLVFKIADAPVGTRLARLRVDGVDSVLVDRTQSPPRFLDRRIEIL